MNTTPETAGYTYADWVTGEPVVPFEVAARLEQERDEARDQLADVRQRLKGHPDSKLDGENGLAAATMRGFEVLQAESEAMSEAIKEAYHSFAEDPGSDSVWLLTDRQTAALAKLQPFLKP